MMKLLALLIAFGLIHVVYKPHYLRTFSWFNKLKQMWLSKSELKSAWINVTIIFLPVIIVAGYLSFVLSHYLSHQLAYLIFNCGVLFYCLGPEPLESELSQQNKPQQVNPVVAEQPELIINRITDASIQRWFAVFFWFVLIGAAGALGYRLLQQSLRAEQQKQTSVHKVTSQLIRFMEYPVILIMAISLLIASDFDRIWRHCRTYFNQTQWYRFHSIFLYEAMDFAVENCEIDTEKPYSQQTLEQTSLAVLKRMLMVWLVLVAFIFLLTIG